MMGNEDMALGKFSVLFIGSSGNLDQCFKHGSASAQPGGIYILDIKEGQEAEPQQIYVQNSPYTVMHAHGIYVSNKTDRLYVVDHLGPKSVIQIMKIVYNKSCLESKVWSCTDPVSLLHIKTISSHLFPRYGINDVVEGINESEIYVTRWLPFPVPEFGAEGWSTLLEKINPILNSIFVLLGIPGTLVYRCNVDKGECEAATDRIFIGSNGITISDDRTTVYVADPTRKQIALMNRTDSGFLTLESWIYLQYGVDNLEIDTQSGIIINHQMGCMDRGVREL
ncbi:serum paraoxonase/lactonase 3 [Eurytemora carolleeae]|uniref:serum paraoxonase/lactonase 3 n=1 Tax=Eurytemora carolleeae TaxID=1294199 RepID=UPI000C78536C|nr:serum paraoxonase/lactonase 3 [Eurytemora carolleeae]|eukprot:XP_023345213.1 serum paraoxonase/lactonase 3-like [Eurytemora affinis]